MEWIECSIECSGDPEELCTRLSELGVEGMSVEDERDFREFLENNRAYWDYVDEDLERRFTGVSRVRFWLSADDEGRTVLYRLLVAGYKVAQSLIADEDWENNWKQYYKPLPVGERILVVPAWEDADTGGRLPLRLDPGLIFGTGSHATTRMCLETLEHLAGPGKRVLDLGCGSGILAIGALLLGCESAMGCDIDPKAPDVAAENAALNGIGPDRFTVYAGDVLTDRGMRASLGSGYDIVLANIVADVIIPLAPLARDFMAPGADFVCSGVINGREAEVESALRRAGLNVVEHRCEEEWHCFRCRAEDAWE